MFRSPFRQIIAAVTAAAGIYFGLALAKFADKDDAPGGVVIGVLLMFGAVGFALWIALRQPSLPKHTE